MYYVIALIAVLLLGLYDYLHNKAGWTLKANLIKYLVCLGVAWFYSTLKALPIFNDLEIVGVVVVVAMSIDIVLKWLGTAWTWIKSFTAKKS